MGICNSVFVQNVKETSLEMLKRVDFATGLNRELFDQITIVSLSLSWWFKILGFSNLSKLDLRGHRLDRASLQEPLDVHQSLLLDGHLFQSEKLHEVLRVERWQRCIGTNLWNLDWIENLIL